jgi:hypothetical protein
VLTFGDYLHASAAYLRAHAPHVRRGQALFNVLSHYRPDLADGLVATPLDPYYNDARVAAFLRRVEATW